MSGASAERGPAHTGGWSVVGNQDVAINYWEKVHGYRLDLSLGLALMDGYFPVSSDSRPEHVSLMLTARSTPEGPALCWGLSFSEARSQVPKKQLAVKLLDLQPGLHADALPSNTR